MSSEDNRTTAETAGAAIGARVLAGDLHAAARLIRDLEDEEPNAANALAVLLPNAGNAFVIGITGPPGAGKSTLVDGLIGAYRDRPERVGVLAVDPSSPLSGGALLGDRVRMQRHATDPGVFIRSFATRGATGGLARVVYDAVTVLDAGGFPVIIIETVGVGQDEVDVAAAADVTVVVSVPGLGDGVQAIKAGLLELADILVVNKADRPETDETVGHLEAMLAMRQVGNQSVPILRTVASRREGVAELIDVLEVHRRAPQALEMRRARRIGRIEATLRASVSQRLFAIADQKLGGAPAWRGLARAAAEGDRRLQTIVNEVVARVSPTTVNDEKTEEVWPEGDDDGTIRR